MEPLVSGTNEAKKKQKKKMFKESFAPSSPCYSWASTGLQLLERAKLTDVSSSPGTGDTPMGAPRLQRWKPNERFLNFTKSAHPAHFLPTRRGESQEPPSLLPPALLSEAGRRLKLCLHPHPERLLVLMLHC